MTASLAGFSPQRILVLQLRQIGDVLLATPSVRLLKSRFPGAAIDFVTEKRCAPVLQNNPDIARVLALDKKAMATPLASLAWYWGTARGGYDLVVDFQQLPRCRFIVAFSRARVRLSYEAPWYNRLLYTHMSPVIGGYAAACKASVLAPLSIAYSGERPRLYLRDEERAWAREYLRSAGVGQDNVLITLDPSHRRATRRWPAEHYGRLADLVLRERPESRFLVLYGPGEEEDARRVAAAATNQERILVPERVLTLREMAAVIDAAGLHLGNCSAPRHFAVAVDTPSLTVLGSTSPAWTFPAPEHAHVARDLPCQPCNKDSCPEGDAPCLTGLAPEAVLPRVLAMLGIKNRQ